MIIFAYLKKYLLCSLLAFIFLILFFQTSIHAKVEAKSYYKVEVEVDEKGDVIVEYNIQLVNQSSDFFIRDYSIICEQSDIIDVKVLENGNRAFFKKEHIDDKIRIRVILSNQLVYKGDKTDIYIRYNTRQLLKDEGQLKLLSVPPIQSEENLKKSDFILKYPKSLGRPSYTSIVDPEFEEIGESYSLRYSQSKAPSGLVLSFIDSQQFEFTYNYRLENQEDEAKNITILLPADTVSQNVYFLDTNPDPEKVFTNVDGNTLIEYKLEAGEIKNVRITGYSQYSNSIEDANIQGDLSRYKEETSIWDYSHEDIREIVNKNTRNDYSDYENAEFLYNLLLSKYKFTDKDIYDNNRPTSKLIKKEKLSCDELTDLYIALLRGADIYSRKVIGYTSLQSSFNSTHSWAEFYDNSESRWISVDTCLSMQKGYYSFDNLDLSRMIFAYRNISSVEPQVIAPFQNYQDLDEESLSLKVSDYDFTTNHEEVSFNFQVGNPDIFFRQVPLMLNITNNSASVFRFERTAINNNDINFTSKHLEGDYIEGVYPGMSKEIALNLSELPDFSIERIENYTLEVFAQYGGNKFYERNDFDLFRPFSYYHVWSWMLAFLASIAFLGLFFFLSKKLRKVKIFKGRKYKYKFKGSKIKGLLE